MSPIALIELALGVQRLPYRWPAPPDAASTETAGAGTCAGKDALLAERLDSARIYSVPLLVVGPLASSLWPDLVEEADGLLEVHECITVLTPWAGPLTVDITWHPAAVAAGLPGMTAEWDGRSDLPTAVAAIGPGYAVDRSSLRDSKEKMRARMYSPNIENVVTGFSPRSPVEQTRLSCGACRKTMVARDARRGMPFWYLAPHSRRRDALTPRPGLCPVWRGM